MNKPLPLATRFTLIFGLILLAGCGSEEMADPKTDQKSELPRVILQTDWYAQPEHAGFYYALEAGFYHVIFVGIMNIGFKGLVAVTYVAQSLPSNFY